MSAYLIWHVRIHNANKMEEYGSQAFPTLEPYDPEFLIFDENSQVIEGDMNFPRTVVMKFDSREAALAWYNSPSYQAARPLRHQAAESYIVLVEG
jgi:uncharacterized protein (DUF1330 family)